MQSVSGKVGHDMHMDLQELEIPKRWDYAKRLKLCFHCLHGCFQSLWFNGYQEVHHRLLHQTETKSSDVSVSEQNKVKVQGNS